MTFRNIIYDIGTKNTFLTFRKKISRKTERNVSHIGKNSKLMKHVHV